MEACAATGAEYVLMLEEDVVAAANWFFQTNITLQSLEEHRDLRKSVYLRIFYTSHLLGWNSEDWLSYVLWSVVAALLSSTLLVLLQRRHKAISTVLTAHAIRVIVFAHMPTCIHLYHSAGRLTVTTLRSGLHPMDQFGCCSQALVYPKGVTPV
jgi:hypothetical protein